MWPSLAHELKAMADSQRLAAPDFLLGLVRIETEGARLKTSRESNRMAWRFASQGSDTMPPA